MQFQLFIFFKTACLQNNFHGRVLSIRGVLKTKTPKTPKTPKHPKT